MLRRSCHLLVLILLTATALSSAANGQVPSLPEGLNGLSSSGTESIPVKPTKIRLVMWVKAEGVDAKSAIKALAAHRTRVAKELAAMKAEEASIEFSAAQVSSGDDDNESNARYMRRSMMQIMQQNGQDVSEMSLPITYTAKAAVKAEWTLPVSDSDALALLPATLTAQIEARDLAGEKNKAELDAAAKEKMEEMQAMMNEQMGGYYSSSEENSNKPKIMLVGEISDEMTKAALKKAYENAVGEAQMIAAASGQKLGKLKSVTRFDNDRYSDMISYDMYGRSSQFPRSLTKPDSQQVVGETAEDLKLTETVVLMHELL